MTTREEKIKKIEAKFDAELEKLTDEQLEQIAGGSINEVSDDSSFLLKYYLVPDNFNKFETPAHWDKISTMVEQGWSKAGIHCFTRPFGKNTYEYDGKKISRGEAMLIVEKKFGGVK